MENKYFEKEQFAARLTPEDIELINDNFEAITGSNEKLSDRKFLLKAVEGAIRNKPKTVEIEKPIDNPETLKELQGAHNKIKELEDEKQRLKLDIEFEKANIKEIEVIKEVPATLKDNQLLVELTPMELYLLNETCKKESERTKQNISPNILLKEMFTTYIFKGIHEHFPLPFNNTQLKKIVEHFKTNINTDESAC